MKMNKFCGLFPAVITPMTPEGELNESAFRKVLEFNIQAGVHGFWIAGGSGESILISEDENQRIAQIAVDQIRGRIGTIMHVSAPTTAAAVRNAENAARAGVDSRK
jgi:4-hydroxy-tetrahydrodipicolinate synthase